MHKLIILLVVLFEIGLCFGSEQQYTAKGILKCGSRPAANVQVKLIDRDNLRHDDEMATTTTDENGAFTITGKSSEVGNIDPTLKIYHECSDGLPCARRWKMKLPKAYITKPGEPEKPVDIGAFNLEINVREEKRKCFG